MNLSSIIANQTVSGFVNLTVDNAPNRIYAVNYYVNEQDISGLLTVFPYSFSWPTTSEFDGISYVYAKAFDSSGNVLATTPSVYVNVNNHGHISVLTSPDPTVVQSGIINLTITYNLAPSNFTQVYIDGYYLFTTFPFNNSTTYAFDTTRFTNGDHVVFMSVYDGSSRPYCQIQQKITINNGSAICQLFSKYNDIQMAPGDSISLAPMWSYCDNSPTTSASVTNLTFYSDNPTCVVVDDAGILYGISPGAAIVYMNSTLLDAHFGIWRFRDFINVTVDTDSGLPHFGNDGSYLRTYDPAKSVYIKCLFQLGISDFSLPQFPNLIHYINAAQINTLNPGFFNNPINNPQPTYAAWKTAFDRAWATTTSFVATNNLMLLLAGDDICRTPKDFGWTLNINNVNTWSDGTSTQAVQYAIAQVSANSRVIGIDMVDEVTTTWGSTPNPIMDFVGPSYNPTIPSNAFTTLVQMVKSAGDFPNLCWPEDAISPVCWAALWMGNAAFQGLTDLNNNPITFADYCREEFDDLATAIPYARKDSVPQNVGSGLFFVISNRQKHVHPSARRILQSGISGPVYTKTVAGDHFVEGPGNLQFAALTPILVTVQIMWGMINRKSGVKTYVWDTNTFATLRRNSAIGTVNLQTGANPYTVSTDNWHAMSASYNLIRSLEKFILQPVINAVQLTSTMSDSTARQCSDGSGRMFCALHYSEAPQTFTIDLSSYMYVGGPAVERRHIIAGTVWVDTIPNNGTDTVTMAGGETIFWIFRPASHAAEVAPTIHFSSPLQNSSISTVFNVQVSGSVANPSFYVDGFPISSTGTTALADLTSYPLGTYHAVSAIATDLNGNTSEARVSVQTSAPYLGPIGNPRFNRSTGFRFGPNPYRSTVLH